MRATPSICLKMWSSMRVSAKIATVDMIINVSSIGQSRCHVIYCRNRQTMTAEVVIARSPESVVASPYVGRKNGSIVIMKMPKPKPVVRCTKLAPMLSRNMAITMLFIINYHKSGCKINENPPNIAIFTNKNVLYNDIERMIDQTIVGVVTVLWLWKKPFD